MVGAKMKNGWTERIKELEAENRRLVALNDTLPQEIARLEDRVSEEYEAERADDRARIKELEAENKRLRELVDGAQEVVEVFQYYAPAGEAWRDEWLAKAQETLEEANHE
jgi:predicted nuclease with TOPRIM domain